MSTQIVKIIHMLINLVIIVTSQLSARDYLNLRNISSIALILGIVNAREAITITNMTVTQRTVTCRIAQCPARDLGRVLEMKLEKTIKLMFVLVLYVLRIETKLK